LHELEAWTLRIIDAIGRGDPVEDQRVELKAEWPQPDRAARRLAGHANAARGDKILWVIGVDEEQGVVGAPAEELANWFPEVATWFDGLTPSLTDLTIPTGGKTVVALLFDTDRAPYVVRNPAHGTPGGGGVEREVPWREATQVRSARREDLVRLLVPTATLPEVEILQGNAILSPKPLMDEDDPVPPPPGPPTAYLNLGLYFVPRARDPIVIPFHRCEAVLSLNAPRPSVTFKKLHLGPARLYGRDTDFRLPPDSLTIEGTSTELVIRGPGQADLHAEAKLESVPDARGDASVTVRLAVAGSQLPLVLDVALPKERVRDGSGSPSWRLASK